MKKYICCFMVLVAMVSSCVKKSSLTVVEVNSFPIEKNISLISLDLKDRLNDPGRLVFHDNMLAITDFGRQGLVYLVSTKEDSVVKKIVNQGRGEGELLCAWGLTSLGSKNNFWALDIVASDVMKINTPNALSDQALSINKVSLRDEASTTMSLDLLNNEEFICSGRFNGFRVAKVNVTGNVVDKIGLSPEIAGEKEFDQYLNEAYQGVIKRNPSVDKFVIACKYTDQIEVFNVGGSNQGLVIKGPVFKEPGFSVVSTKTGSSMALDPKSCFEMYSDVAVTDNYIIGLFSGKALGQHSYNGNTIFVFDWSGNAVAKFTINQECLSIAVDPSTNRVYLLSIDPSPEVFYFDLNV